MRFPIVLFDLDGTVVDSGDIILASMRHAAKEVLGVEPPDELLMAAVGGPGLEAQMHALAPDLVDELVSVYRAHNEPLHDELACCPGMDEVLVRLRDEGRRLGIVTAKRRQTVELAFAKIRSRTFSRRSSAATRRSGTSRIQSRCCSRSSGSAGGRSRRPTSGTHRSTYRLRRPRVYSPSA